MHDVDVVAQKYLCIHVAAHDAETEKKVQGHSDVKADRKSVVVCVVREKKIGQIFSVFAILT